MMGRGVWQWEWGGCEDRPDRHPTQHGAWEELGVVGCVALLKCSLDVAWLMVCEQAAHVQSASASAGRPVFGTVGAACAMVPCW